MSINPIWIGTDIWPALIGHIKSKNLTSASSNSKCIRWQATEKFMCQTVENSANNKPKWIHQH